MGVKEKAVLGAKFPPRCGKPEAYLQEQQLKGGIC